MSDWRERMRFNVRIALAVVLYILRTRGPRRQLMFYVTVAVLAMFFLGVFVLEGALSRHPFFFLLWWAVCFALLALMMLMALYDMLRLRQEHAERDQRELKQVLKEIREESEDRR